MKNQQLVILKGGTGKKRQFNGTQAKILKRRGSWISVELQQEQGDLSTIKWRSKAFYPARTEFTVANLFVSLPDDVIQHILSFLFGEGATTDWNKVRSSLQSLLFLNKSFHEKLFSSILPKTQFSANLMHLAPAQTFYALIGITKCHFKLESVQLGDVGHWDFDFVGTLFCNHWDISEVKCLKIKLLKRELSGLTRILCPAASGASFTEDGAYDLTMDEVHDDVLDYIQIPEAYANLTRPQFHALTLQRFQNLTTLRTTLDLNSTDWNDIKNSILQIRSIQTLDLTLQSERYYARGITRLAELISGMPHLENLVLRSVAGEQREGVDFRDHISLRSPVLRIADVTRLWKGFFLQKVVCPRLERFICHGGCFGNGVRVGDPRVYENTKFPMGVHDHPLNPPNVEYTVRDQAFFGMHVPDDCIVAFV